MGDLDMVDESSWVGEMCWGGAITWDKLDGAEGVVVVRLSSSQSRLPSSR